MMAQSFALLDHATREDLRVYLERLLRAGEAEARLVTRGDALAVYGCVQAPEGLLDTAPVVLVMRAFALSEAPQPAIDVTVAARALLDRIARLGVLGLHLEVPEVTASAAWAGVLPPVSGWESAGALDSQSLADVAKDGMQRIAKALPDNPGEAIVRSVRRSVWGSEIAPELPAISAFAGEAMGFLRGSEAAVISRSRTWVRVSMSRGHVLIRRNPSVSPVV